MGVFDYRCVATGLPLRSSRVQFLAMMEVEAGRFAPVSLPVAGIYDSYGRIARFAQDFRITVLANGIEEAARAGRVLATTQSLDALNRKRPVTPETAIDMIERCTTMSEWAGAEANSLKVDGKLLQHCYFDAQMFSAIVGKAGDVPKKEPSPDEVKALVTKAFPDAFGAWLHRDLHKLGGESRRKVAGAMNEVIALVEFMTAYDVKWGHPGTGQFAFGDELNANLEARKRFAKHAALQKALMTHARKVEDEADEQAGMGDEALEKLPERWVRDAAVAWYGLRAGEAYFATSSLAGLRTLVHAQFANGLTEVIAVQNGVIAKRIPLGDKKKDAGPLWDSLEQELPALTAPIAKQESLVWGEAYELRVCERTD